MKNKIMKGIFLFLLFVGMVSVKADSTIDFSRKGSINLTIEDAKGTSVPNVQISIYKIADAASKNANLVYNVIPELSSCSIDLSSVDNITINQELINCVQKNHTFKETKKTGNNGKISFNNLDLGIYLLVQEDKTIGYSKIDPYMISIPQIEDNNWIYDINSMPKSDIYKVVDINVKKVWNSEGKKHDDSVTIELLNGNEVMDTVVLNAENNWNYTWYDIEEDDGYSVVEKDIPKDYVATYFQEGYNFIVTNTIKLPETGLQLWLVEILAVCGTLSLIVGLAINKKYENN